MIFPNQNDRFYNFSSNYKGILLPVLCITFVLISIVSLVAGLTITMTLKDENILVTEGIISSLALSEDDDLFIILENDETVYKINYDIYSKSDHDVLNVLHIGDTLTLTLAGADKDSDRILGLSKQNLTYVDPADGAAYWRENAIAAFVTSGVFGFSAIVLLVFYVIRKRKEKAKSLNKQDFGHQLLESIRSEGDSVLWHEKLTKKKAAFIVLKPVSITLLGYIAIGGFLLLYQKINTAAFLILFIGISFFTTLIMCISATKEQSLLIYIITDKGIIIASPNLLIQLGYNEMKDIKLIRPFFDKNKGSLKFIPLHKSSVNYIFKYIENPEEIFKLIMSHKNPTSEREKEK